MTTRISRSGKMLCVLHGEHDPEGHYECIGNTVGWTPRVTTAFLMARYENVVLALSKAREHSADHWMHKGYLSALRTALKRMMMPNEFEAFLQIHRGRD